MELPGAEPRLFHLLGLFLILLLIRSKVILAREETTLLPSILFKMNEFELGAVAQLKTAFGWFVSTFLEAHAKEIYSNQCASETVRRWGITVVPEK